MLFDSFQLQSKLCCNGKPHFKNTKNIKLVSSRNLIVLKRKNGMLLPSPVLFLHVKWRIEEQVTVSSLRTLVTRSPTTVRGSR